MKKYIAIALALCLTGCSARYQSEKPVAYNHIQKTYSEIKKDDKPSAFMDYRDNIEFRSLTLCERIKDELIQENDAGVRKEYKRMLNRMK
ncbi:MAG: hypothetical protein U9R08_03965 [Nanoarchaeota archaeon]|nr:hypothetical protein [Nanoarchaeota archaeon]